MAMKKNVLAAALAVVALAVSSASAFAAPARVDTHLNVRSGPGTNYRVVDSVSRGQVVDVQYCRGNWCFVEKPGPDGWVSARYLSRGGNWDRPQRPDWDRPGWDRPNPGHPGWNNPRPPRPPHYPQRPGASACFNGPNGYFCFGS
jgi:hypothetical protein